MLLLERFFFHGKTTKGRKWGGKIPRAINSDEALAQEHAATAGRRRPKGWHLQQRGVFLDRM
jgi:hypothetical protein